jgi:hypothetical protein
MNVAECVADLNIPAGRVLCTWWWRSQCVPSPLVEVLVTMQRLKAIYSSLFFVFTVHVNKWVLSSPPTDSTAVRSVSCSGNSGAVRAVWWQHRNFQNTLRVYHMFQCWIYDTRSFDGCGWVTTIASRGKQLGREVDWHPSSAEVKNEWCCTSASPHAFTACTETSWQWFFMLACLIFHEKWSAQCFSVRFAR